MNSTTNDIKWRYFFVWLAILLPVAVMTSDWILFHWFILFFAWPSCAWHAYRYEEGSKSWPFVLALMVSLLTSILGHEYFLETGWTGILTDL